LSTQSIGHGFKLGPLATGYEVVRIAQNFYECEGAAIDADAVDDGIELSPGTGSIVLEGWSESCEVSIKSGCLYVAQEYTGEMARDFGDFNQYTFRTCLTCATHFKVIVTETR
jgi:hypothetical protein